MRIDEGEVIRLAEMIKIELSPEEIAAFPKDLTAVLGYVEILNRVDTEGVRPMTSGTDQPARLRDDVPEESLAPEQTATMAGARFDPEHNAFVVQKVLPT